MNAVPGIAGGRASGSAQFSGTELQHMLAKVQQPLTIVDLRQEPHGLLTINPPLAGETDIAVGWFTERDWLNVAKGRASIEADEINRLAAAAGTQNLVVYSVTGKTAEDGIASATPSIVSPLGEYRTEQQLALTLAEGYVRFPTTDHCRPRDSEVDRFVSFEKSLAADMWLHVHCRGGDGRTTTFMAMHDMIHNAPQDSLQVILARQGPHGIGGVDLTKTGDPISFEYPFAAERSTFVQDFYRYVCEAKPNQFAPAWSDWVRQECSSKSRVWWPGGR